MPRLRLVLAALLAASLLAAACGSDVLPEEGVSPASANPILIGWVGPLTDGAVSEGQEMLAAAEIAVEQVNAAGGVLGRDVELVARDTMNDANVGIAAMEELIDDIGVVAVIGEVHSSVAVAEIEIAHDRGIPFVVADAWADEITAAGYPEVFRIAPANSLIYQNVSDWVVNAGFARVSVVVEATAYGANASQLIGSALDAAGIESTFHDVDAEAIDVDAVIADLDDDGADLIMVLVASNTVYPLIDAICTTGLAPSVDAALYVGAGPGVADSLWDEVGECGRYVIAEDLVLPRAQWNDLATGLEAAMAERGLNAAIGGFAGFDSLWLTADAIGRAGSTEPDAVISALATTTFTGARGTYSFSSDTEPAWRFQTFIEAPETVIQYLEVGQSADEAAILTPPGWATVDTYAVPG